MAGIAMQEGKSGFFPGQLLIATPSITESCFAKSVIYLCSHQRGGAMGLIINQPSEDARIFDIYQQLQFDDYPHSREIPVHHGGPVEQARGFVLHTADVQVEGSILSPDGNLAVTANVNLLQAIASGKGPRQALLMLGYAGWSAGQLEAEMEQGGWIVAPASPSLIFDMDNEMKWMLAGAALGVDMNRVSTMVGHA